MIPRTVATWQSQSWQEQMTDLVRDPAELCRLLELDPAAFRDRHVQAAGDQFELRVPRSFVRRMRPGDLEDPLLLQVLPQAREMIEASGFGTDPLAESAANPRPGIIHKYHGRVLLMLASACAINCRYCFRRHFPYGEQRQSREQWRKTLKAIAADPSIQEVIYSGGDPLTVSDRQLTWFTEQLRQIPHVKTLRVHTRLPVVIPERINKECLSWLEPDRLRVVMVLHSNHPAEIDSGVGAAMERLRERGVVLLNQAVLLRGINDKVRILASLSEALFRWGALPYYLHLLDRVAGAQHFEVPETEAIALHNALKAELPGYLVPKLAKELPGADAKLVLG